MKILIMAGGTGTRLWPMSTKDQPKQFQKLFNNKTLLQTSIDRLLPKFKLDDIFIITNQSYVPLVKKQIPRLAKKNIIIDPYKRNTAPCVGLATVIIAKKNPNETLAVLTADHLIQKGEEFLKILSSASKFLEQFPDYLVTLGIKPDHPATGYGYVRAEKPLAVLQGNEIFKVRQFIEKPDLRTAKRFIKNWQYFWNSGMFIWKADSILKEFKKHLPAIYKKLLVIKKNLNNRRIIDREYKKMQNISIDYGIMEKAERVAVIPANLGWSDIGSWKILKEVLSKNDKDNIIKGKQVYLDTQGSLIYSTSKKLIATIGLKDIIVVETDKAILICPKEKSQDVKKITETLEKKKMNKYL